MWSAFLYGKGGDILLTVKQEKFCHEYLKTGNARQAYINAGYSFKKESTADVNACRLLKNDKVQVRLDELRQEVETEAIADIREMQKALTDIIRQSMDEEIIVVEGCGDGVSEAKKMNKKPSIDNVIKAINTLGKMQGAFIDKLNVTGAIPVVIKEDIEV